MCVCIYPHKYVLCVYISISHCSAGRLSPCYTDSLLVGQPSSGYSEAYAATFYSMSYKREKLDFSSPWVPNLGKYKN